MSTEPEYLRNWLAKQGDEITPLTTEQMESIFTWSTKHGSGNGWTGTTGEGAMFIRWLLRDWQRLRNSLAAVEELARRQRGLH